MPHAHRPHGREHPLAGHHVGPGARAGEAVTVVDWLDRRPERHWILAEDSAAAQVYRARIAPRGLDLRGTVLARAAGARVLVHESELPACSPVTAGCAP